MELGWLLLLPLGVVSFVYLTDFALTLVDAYFGD